jgi:SsrA-binding protein
VLILRRVPILGRMSKTTPFDKQDNSVKKKEEKTIAKNRRAFHEYEILETFEAGIVLTGTEVRSLREHNCQLTDCFALVRNGEVWMHNVHIAPFSNGTIFNVDPDRKRKLLLHKKQIRELERAVSERGMALVPLKMYFKENSLVKVELAIARGKKNYDKRASMAERDSKREIERALKQRSR